jgi:hypothetical protein
MLVIAIGMRKGHTHHYYCVLCLLNGREDDRDKSGESATIFLDSSESRPFNPASRTWQSRIQGRPQSKHSKTYICIFWLGSFLIVDSFLSQAILTSIIKNTSLIVLYNVDCRRSMAFVDSISFQSHQ